MKKKLWAVALTGALTLGGITQVAQADDHDDKKVAVKITHDKAKKIALKSVKGKVTDVDLERKNKQWVYEVEIRTTKGEQEVHVDAQTGKILAKSQVKITRDQAKKIALAKVKGKVTEMELENKNGVWVYEVEVTTAKGETDMYINAQKGEISSIRHDNDDDDDRDDWDDDRYDDDDRDDWDDDQDEDDDDDDDDEDRDDD
ncbi:PepSY domain-containing protein [Bacillus sp. Hm123]|uniref:PepSY domain-containing protein n=1 Tax=Bacillus sp. Hm123 TaxID=3450745 RepID=UPI003F440D1B